MKASFNNINGWKILLSLQFAMTVTMISASASAEGETHHLQSPKQTHHMKELLSVSNQDHDSHSSETLQSQIQSQGQGHGLGQMSMSLPEHIIVPLDVPQLPLSLVNPIPVAAGSNLRLTRPREYGFRIGNSNYELEPELDLEGEVNNPMMPEPEEVSKLSHRQLVEFLLERFNKAKSDSQNLLQQQQQKQSQILLQKMTDRAVKSMCAQSASLTCGKIVLETVEGKGDTSDKCNMRKDFLDCITDSREDCNEMVLAGVFPTLPSKTQISEIQKRVWRALWTSGGCVLAA